RRRPFKRENHYWLKTYTEAPLDSPDHAPALRQLGGRMRNNTVIDMAIQPMPYEAGGKFFHRFEVTAAGAGMARRPGEVRMSSRTELVNMAEKSGHRCDIEMIEIHRAVVDREVKRRQFGRLHPGRAIGRDQRSYVLVTHLWTRQPCHNRSVGVGFVLRMQVVDYASAAVS